MAGRGHRVSDTHVPELTAMYAAAFLPVVIGLDRQEAVLHPLEPRSTGRKLLGAAWVLVFPLAWKVSDLSELRARLDKNLGTQQEPSDSRGVLGRGHRSSPAWGLCYLSCKLRSLHVNLYFC